MKRGTKRNWTMVTFMAVLIIFGHWLDFFQMVMPGTVRALPPDAVRIRHRLPVHRPHHVGTGNYLSKHSLLARTILS